MWVASEIYISNEHSAPPVQVAGLVGRADVLAALFYISAILFYKKAVEVTTMVGGTGGTVQDIIQWKGARGFSVYSPKFPPPPPLQYMLS